MPEIRAQKFFAINKGMILIKMIYFMWDLGVYMVLPFLTLQALGLGLTYADISIVYGLSPILCLGAQPLAGFIGDKIGFRVVLMIYILLNLLLETSLTLIPVYQEHEQIGSHGVTFFSYLAIRTATEWARKSTFALLDGASLRLANEHHSDVSKVATTNQIAIIFASLIPAFVLEDSPEGSPEFTDYSVLFYIMAGCKFTTAMLVFWLRVNIERSPQSTKESLKNIWNKPALTLFSLLFILGFVAAVKEAYAIPYLTDDLGASSQLISIMLLVGSIAALMGNLIAKKVISVLGELNIIFIGIIIECSRLVLWAVISATPPYYSIFLFILDTFTNALPLVGLLFYSNKIAPPDLIATMAAVAGVFFWTIGRGSGGFVGGQLTTTLDITEVFVYIAVFGALSGSLVMAVKMSFGAKWERQVLQEKEVLMEQMKNINGEAKGNLDVEKIEYETKSL